MVYNVLTAYVYRISFRRHRQLKLPLSCKIAKKVVFGPRFVGGRDTPDFAHAFSNYIYLEKHEHEPENCAFSVMLYTVSRKRHCFGLLYL